MLSRRGAIFIFILATGVFAACKKKGNMIDFTRRDDLLGNWSRVFRAYDVNDNHILDSSETFVGPGTDTFLLNLANDATYQRVQTFKGEDFPEYGTWHLQSNDGQIVFQPTTSTSSIDTFGFDTVSTSYFRFHKVLQNSDTWYWEAYERR